MTPVKPVNIYNATTNKCHVSVTRLKQTWGQVAAGRPWSSRIDVHVYCRASQKQGLATHVYVNLAGGEIPIRWLNIATSCGSERPSITPCSVKSCSAPAIPTRSES